jgi:hypothetical protein
VIYKKINQFKNNEEELERLIFTNSDEIKSLIVLINYNIKKGSFTNNNNITVNLSK